MKIKTILKLFCKSCDFNAICKTKCKHYNNFKKLLEEHEAKKGSKIIMCPNCLYVFYPKDPHKKADHLPTKNEGFEIKEETKYSQIMKDMHVQSLQDIEIKEEKEPKPSGLKILVQLEIKYGSRSEWNYETGYPHLINAIKTYFENDITIPET